MSTKVTRRIGRDLRHRRNVEAYVVAAAAVVFALLSVLGDLPAKPPLVPNAVQSAPGTSRSLGPGPGGEAR